MSAWSAPIRSQRYAFLARAFMPPESGEEPAVSAEVRALWPSLPSEAQALTEAWHGNGDLRSAYQRLFLGPARPRVDAYESCYRGAERRLAGPWAAQVAALYADEGLTVEGLLPDHIAAEMAFMAHLAAQEAAAASAGDEEARQRYHDAQAAFLRQHLLVWGLAFSQRLEREATHPFYTALARLLAAWLDEEAERFGLRQADAVALAYPVAVKTRLCTLCGVCAEACTPGALHLRWEGREAQLRLEPEGCTGCRLCAEVCPFKALKLGDAPTSRILVRSPLLPCPDCGRLALPEAFWQRITRRLASTDPAAVAARRCRACREEAVRAVTAVERRAHSTSL